MHDIATRLVLVAWFYGGFFEVRTVYFGEHMIDTTREARQLGLKEAWAKGWLKRDSKSNDWFLDEKGWSEVVHPLNKSIGIDKLKEMYPKHLVDFTEEEYWEGIKCLIGSHKLSGLKR